MTDNYEFEKLDNHYSRITLIYPGRETLRVFGVPVWPGRKERRVAYVGSGTYWRQGKHGHRAPANNESLLAGIEFAEKHKSNEPCIAAGCENFAMHHCSYCFDHLYLDRGEEGE